jgi:hypothetical protein
LIGAALGVLIKFQQQAQLQRAVCARGGPAQLGADQIKTPATLDERN